MAAPLQADGSRYGFVELARAPRAVLEQTLRGGAPPAFGDLVGWEFDGINTLPLTVLVGIRKFRKGFYEGPPRSPHGPEPFIQGYNVPVRPSPLEAPHRARPSDEAPRRFSFYRVHRVVPGARFSRYPQALLLDYSLGCGPLDPARGLRDYLVQVYPDDPTLLLGKAYYSLFGLPVLLSYFVLARRHRHDFAG